MTKKAIIEIFLVPESINKKPAEIENEILKEFDDGSLKIPWCNKIGKIVVVDS